MFGGKKSVNSACQENSTPSIAFISGYGWRLVEDKWTS